MKPTNIDVDRIEQALPLASLKIRNQLIEEAIKKINTWLTPDPNITEVINVFFYRDFFNKVTQKFNFNIVEQRQLLEEMFDNNIYVVYVNKTTKSLTTKTLFGMPKLIDISSENSQFVFTRLSLDIKREINTLKEICEAMRNPRVMLSLKEHRNLVQILQRFNINLADYYI